MTSFEDLLALQNKLLKAAKVKVRIFMRGNKLWLRATLPPRANSKKTKRHPQAVATGFTATTIGLSNAVRKAKLFALQVATEQFNWSDWVNSLKHVERVRVDRWVEAYQLNYFKKRRQSFKKQTTWDTDYYASFKKLSLDRLLDVDHLLEAALASDLQNHSLPNLATWSETRLK